jgi:hypothetical protein
MDALKRYDENRPLENFLSVNLSNRLKNFVRDHHFVKNDNGDRVKVLQPAQLDYEHTIADEEGKPGMSYDDLDIKNMVELINEHLPASIRMDYLRIIHDVYITKQRRDEVLELIEDILKEHGFHEEG